MIRITSFKTHHIAIKAQENSFQRFSHNQMSCIYETGKCVCPCCTVNSSLSQDCTAGLFWCTDGSRWGLHNSLQTAAAGIDHSGHCQLAVIIMMVLPAGQALRKRLTYRERSAFIIFCVIAARHTQLHMSVHLNRVSPHPTGCWIGIWTGRTGRGFH